MLKSFILLGLSGLAIGSAQASETSTYSYDALGRLVGTNKTGTVNNGVAVTTIYDPADNRASYVVTGSSSVMVAPPNEAATTSSPKN